MLKNKFVPLLRFNTEEPPLAADEVRIPLFPSKMMESDGKIKPAEARNWFWRSVLNAYASSLGKSLLITGPLYLTWAVSFAHMHLEYYGAASLLHAPFLFALALGNVFALVYTLLIAFIFASLRVSPSIYTPFPEAVYLNPQGFAFGAKKRFIAWDKVLLARTRKLHYRGLRDCDVLELYLEKDAFVKKANPIRKILDKVELNSLRRNYHFLEAAANKEPANMYEGECLRLPLDLFGFDADCVKFIKTLRENAPANTVQAELPQQLESAPAVDSSFTALWLSELRSPQSINTRRLLEAGHALQNGRYELTGVLGYGGFSVVYSATTNSSDRGKDVVAIKEVIINSGGTRTSKETILRQIISEIELLKSLDHPNVVKCLDYFIDSGRIYIVMQALQGHNLRNSVDECGAMQERDLLNIASQCCSILHYLHTREKPLMHRDFTPDNLIWDGQTVKLVDFNVAEEVNTNASQTIVGKHCFLSPEQWCGTFTPAGDLYQLGCSLYYLATGKDPEPLTQSDPATVRNDLSEPFCALVRKLTTLEADERYATASDTAIAVKDISGACVS
ncbi:MAG: serine/threonine protein kinase [Cyanobacteria bacterium SZAS LIN-2]|nr:serine/threonine protein kinase [Cyanobacteria bacterium SZAS LIN-2]